MTETPPSSASVTSRRARPTSRPRGWMLRIVGSSVVVQLGVSLLGVILLAGTFADLLASPEPLLAQRADGSYAVLPALTRSGAPEPDAVEAEHRGDRWTVWAPLRAGPRPGYEGLPPTLKHPLGTDDQGRDVASRLVHGAQSSLGLALLAVVMAMALGGTLGAIAGYRGGVWDDVLARHIELIEAIPTVLVVAVFQAVAGRPSMVALGLAVIAVRWAEAARLVRVEVMRLRAEDFVVGARAIGAGPSRVLRRHILPHVLPRILVTGVFGVASVTLIEVSVAFLGFGVEGSWGTMIADGLKPEAGLFVPGVAGAAFAVSMISMYLLADTLVDSSDARVAQDMLARANTARRRRNR